MNRATKFIIYLVFFIVLGLVLGRSTSIRSYFQDKANSSSPEIVAVPTPEIPSPSPEILFSEPQKINIPKINVSAIVESVAMDSKGRMDIPKKDEDTAWYNLGVKPGERGNAVIDGHLDTKTGAPAVFWDLNKLKAGDEITVTDKNEKQLKYKVTSVNTYDDATFPLQEVFGETQKYRLNLITCAGVFDSKARNYSKRVVAYSELEQ